MVDFPDWDTFIIELHEKILPIYRNHEINGGFDPHQIHGRMHICRSLIFAEWMARRCDAFLDQSLNHYAIWIAVAFHDSMRKDGGKDYWEKESADACRDYLLSKSPYAALFSAAQVEETAGWIFKNVDHSLSHRIVYDVDVLEYMRLLHTLEGSRGFRVEKLYFAGSNDPLRPRYENPDGLQKALIREAWWFIQETEQEVKSQISQSNAYLADLLAFLDRNHPENSLLAEVLAKTGRPN